MFYFTKTKFVLNRFSTIFVYLASVKALTNYVDIPKPVSVAVRRGSESCFG
jgi:hypothetical protein